MTWLTEQNDWKALPKDDKSFIYEMGVSAIGAILLVTLLG
jgi:hypothetical protein